MRGINGKIEDLEVLERMGPHCILCIEVVVVAGVGKLKEGYARYWILSVVIPPVGVDSADKLVDGCHRRKAKPMSGMPSQRAPCIFAIPKHR